MAEEKHGHKSKTASVLLAVFLKFFLARGYILTRKMPGNSG